MNFIAANKSHIEQIITWIDNQEKLVHWGGPLLKFPLEIEAFMSDLDLENKLAFSLISDEEELLGFGQYYKRLSACHLGRLIVSPKHRGKALVVNLIDQLLNNAAQTFSFETVSLFVYSDNSAALSAYERLGFVDTAYPEEMPFENIVYMTKPLNFSAEC